MSALYTVHRTEPGTYRSRFSVHLKGFDDLRLERFEPVHAGGDDTYHLARQMPVPVDSEEYATILRGSGR